MDTTQLKYFIAIAQTQNFSEAARRCEITQPAISHSISELEKQLGAQLFVRSKKSVAITDVGKELLPAALDMVALEEKILFNIGQTVQGKKGHLRISALTTSSKALSKCLSIFSERYPEIVTDISFTSGYSQVMAMNDSEYDFHFAVKEMVPVGNTFESIVTQNDYLCVAFPKDHPLAGQPLDFSKLADERYITISENESPLLYNVIMHVCESRNYAPNIVCKYDRAESVLMSVNAGNGISIIPETLKDVFSSENVKFVRIPGGDTIRTYVVAWHKDLVNPAAKLFLEIIKEVFSDQVSE